MAHRPYETTITGAAVQAASGPGMGFFMEPLTNKANGNPVRFPVKVRLDADPAREFIVENDGPRTFHPGFATKLEILDGASGDRWRVTVLEVPEDLKGNGIVTRRPPTVIASKTDWSDLGEWVPGAAYTLTGVGAATDAQVPSELLDVSDYDTLTLGVLFNYASSTSGLQLDVELHFYADPGGNVVAESVTATLAASGDTFVAVAGPGMVATTGVTAVPRRYPYVKLRYTFSNGSQGDYTLGGAVVCLSGSPRV